MNETADKTTAVKKRLNPFALPTETDALFRLLVIAAWLVAILLGRVLLLALNPHAAFDGSFVQNPNLGQRAAFLQELLPSALLTIVMTLLLFGLAYVLYRSYPGRIRRSKALEPLTPEKDRAFYSSVHQLVLQTGISPQPSLELGTGLSGLAFDYRPHQAIALDGSPRGLRLQLRRAPDAVQAIVLHEAAHIANQDVERSYVAQALWTAIVPVTVIPLLAWVLVTGIRSLVNVGTLSPSAAAILSAMVLSVVRVTILLGVVGLLRAQLLRTRELYADARAASWGARQGLLKNLGNPAASERNTRINAWLLHPPAAERIAAIENPERLFRSSWVIPFVTGFLLALVMSGLMIGYLPAATFILEQIRWLRPALGPDRILLWLAARLLWFAMAFLLLIGPVVFVGVLVHGALGVQIRRQTVLEEVDGRAGKRRYLGLIGPAIFVALGLEVGFFAIPFSPLAADSWRELVVAIFWVPIAGVAAFLWLASYRYLVLRTYRTQVGSGPTKRGDRALAVISTGMLVLLFIPTILVSRLAFDNGQTVLSRIPISLAALLLSGVVYGVFLVISWLVFRVRSAAKTPHCPACGSVIKRSVSLAESCETCHSVLAPWLFTA